MIEKVQALLPSSQFTICLTLPHAPFIAKMQTICLTSAESVQLRAFKVLLQQIKTKHDSSNSPKFKTNKSR